MSNEFIYFLCVLVQNMIIVIYLSTVFNYKYEKKLTNIILFLFLTSLFFLTLFTEDFKILKVFIIFGVQTCFYKLISTNTWKETIKKSFMMIFISLLSELISDTIFGFTAYLTGARLDIDRADIYDNLRVVNGVMGLPLYMSTVLIYGIFYRKITGPIKKRLIILLSIIPIAIFPLHYVLYSYNIDTFTPTTIMFIFVCILAFTIIPVAIYKLIINSEEYIKKEQELEHLKEKEKNEYDYYKMILEKEEKIRKINHDIKNDLQIISTMKKEEDRIKFVSKIAKRLDDNKIVKYSNNEILNIILNLKENLARDKKIDVSFKIENDLDFLDEIDLCNLLVNILDNAIESQETIKNKKIDLKIYKKMNYYVIKEINNVNNSVNLSKSSKGENHGYGIKIIKDIVKKYKGEIEYKEEKDNLSLIITFKK